MNSDMWTQLSDIPFEFGVSSGGGLATDGRYIYAADFSGDSDDDHIDLNRDLQDTSNETLGELGIANASVRFLRYDPRTDEWTELPTLNSEGILDEDSRSDSNSNNPLFVAGDKLYYYQSRQPGFNFPPHNAELYSYDLSQGENGVWESVFKSQKNTVFGVGDDLTTEPFIRNNTALKGIDIDDQPVIFHPNGGGQYNLFRSDNFGNANRQRTKISPQWDFNTFHFPNNGAWEFDENNDAIFHISGNQLIQWIPNDEFYEDGGFLTSTPDDTNNLALQSTVVESLKAALDWGIDSDSDQPGASLWGNSLAIINDPNGTRQGRDKLDTGNNVLYVVRGESSDDVWPFNEGRGLINNGDFARIFLDTGEIESLERIPFDVGKGSTSVYLDGYLYVTQGDTRTVADNLLGPDNLFLEGIRNPGSGFARFKIDPNADDRNLQGKNQIIGTDANDTLNGDTFDLNLNDSIEGRRGDDEIFSGNGDDFVSGSFGNDTILGATGDDSLLGNYGEDRIFGGLGDDSIYGGQQDDSLEGEQGDDIIRSGGGNDFIDGGTADDSLFGDRGDDTIRGGVGKDIIFGGDGDDLLWGQANNDFILGGNGNDTILGNAGDDSIRGSVGLDRINAGGGNDLVSGGGDNDRLLGGDGTDTLFGDEGDDRILGGDDDDLIFGGLGEDKLFGQDGDDTIWGGDNSDRIFGETGDDLLISGSGDDTVIGESGSDTLRAGAGNDLLLGAAGSDNLVGGAGNDSLFGGGGQDILRGGLGFNLLTGGLGRDIFIVESSSSLNVIQDFELGVDQIGFVSGLSVSELAFQDAGSNVEILFVNNVIASISNVSSEEIRNEANFRI